MTAQPAPDAPVRRMSKSSLLSFICGILGCIPFATGALAILFGIIGFIRTGNPMKTGRWMAVVGTLLGLVSVVLWSLFGTAIIGIVWTATALTEPVRNTTTAYIQALANEDLAAASTHSLISEEQNKKLSDALRTLGHLKSTEFSSSRIDNDTGETAGKAILDTESIPFEAKLRYTDGNWKITEIVFKPKD